ncbi:MAG TPA: Rieske (2Fe-2S) protein [Longimicrobium sp.]|nr:Rieske (2Fe-2S) protein [Longimicrobium sp.]
MEDVTMDPCAGCAGVTRRQFVERSTLVAVAAFLAACGGGSGGGSPTLSQPFTFSVSSYAALSAVGGIARVNAGSAPVAVVRTGADSFLAFSMVCPHQGTTINISGGAFVCPNHGARFNAQGQWTGGQRTSNLRSVALSYNATAGTITLG